MSSYVVTISANGGSGTADVFPHSITVFLAYLELLLLVPCGCSTFRLQQKKEIKLNLQDVDNPTLCVLDLFTSHLYSFQIMRRGLLLLLLHQNQNRSKTAGNQHLETRAETRVLELLRHMCGQIRACKQSLSAFG